MHGQLLVLGPPDIEERIGLTGGNIFQDETLPDQIWDRRLESRTPLDGLYLCGAATDPAGSVIALQRPERRDGRARRRRRRRAGLAASGLVLERARDQPRAPAAGEEAERPSGCSTSSRFWKPIRYQRWTTSQVTQARKPLSRHEVQVGDRARRGRSSPGCPCRGSGTGRRLAGPQPRADDLRRVAALLHRHRRDAGKRLRSPSRRGRCTMSPSANTSGWPGQGQVGLDDDAARPGRPRRRSAPPSRLARSDAFTPAAQITVRAGIARALRPAPAPSPPSSSMPTTVRLEQRVTPSCSSERSAFARERRREGRPARGRPASTSSTRAVARVDRRGSRGAACRARARRSGPPSRRRSAPRRRRRR